MKTYLVGGAVRDKALGRQQVDRDWVVVGSSPEQMTELGFIPVGNDFPVFIHPKSGEEYALARTERKVQRGYQGFKFNTSSAVTLEQDLSRRDFTINAMAEDEGGQLIDPFNGLQDLQNGIIRHVSDAFVEDPVRILRAARFAARFRFNIAPETQQLLSQMVENGEVDSLVPERVWNEMHKALNSEAPQIFYQVLKQCGALERILPEIDNLFGIPQTARYHPEIDTGIHTMMVIEQAAKLSHNPIVRFAALVHDLGKAKTPKNKLPSHCGHEKSGLPLIKNLCDRLRIPKKFEALALAVAEYHLHMHKMADLKASTVLKMLEKTGSLKDDNRAQQIALCCTADARGRAGFEQRSYPQADLFLQFQQAAKQVDGASIARQIEKQGNTGHTGSAIQAELREARISAIKKIKLASSQTKAVKPQ